MPVQWPRYDEEMKRNEMICSVLKISVSGSIEDSFVKYIYNGGVFWPFVSVNQIYRNGESLLEEA